MATIARRAFRVEDEPRMPEGKRSHRAKALTRERRQARALKNAEVAR